MLATTQIQHDPYPREAIFIAGAAFLQYRRGGGARQRILPDFLIGAHALASGATLLTRDRGFYRPRFPGLRLAR
jgi:predicted nucleic acid-binding protein